MALAAFRYGLDNPFLPLVSRMGSKGRLTSVLSFCPMPPACRAAGREAALRTFLRSAGFPHRHGPWQLDVHVSHVFAIACPQPPPRGEQVAQHRHSGVETHPLLTQELVPVQQPRMLGAAEVPLYSNSSLEQVLPLFAGTVDDAHYPQSGSFGLLRILEVTVAAPVQPALQVASFLRATEPVFSVRAGFQECHFLPADADWEALLGVQPFVQSSAGFLVFRRPRDGDDRLYFLVHQVAEVVPRIVSLVGGQETGFEPEVELQCGV